MPKKSPDMPPPPDPYAVANAQQGLNVGTALAQSALNQYEEVTPYGRSYYEPTGTVRTFGSGGEYTGSTPARNENPQITGMRANLEQLTPEMRRRIMGSPMGAMMLTSVEQGLSEYDRNNSLNSFQIPTMRRITEFSPEQQRIFDAEMGLTGDLYDLASGYTNRIAEGLKDPFSYEGLPDAPTADAASRQQVIDALYGQHTSRLDPQFEQNRRALATRLANQGIPLDSDAYRSEMERFGRTRNDAYNTALSSAIAAGGAEQSRLFGLQSAARERAIQERAYLRDRPINEITGLVSGRGVTMPQFSAVPQTSIGTADFQGASYASHQAAMQQAQIEAQARQSMMSNIFGLGGALLGGAGSAGGFGSLFSDERLKKNIRPTGVSVGGLPVKTWDWKSSGVPDMGFIAQDVQRRVPGAVSTDPATGFKKVDYHRAALAKALMS